MKKFLAAAAFCLALVPAGAFAFHTVFPDGNAMTHAALSQPAPAPFTSCSQSLPWYKLYAIDLNNLSTLFPLHVRVFVNCLDTTGGLFAAYLTDYYAPAAPTITDTGTAYSVVWAIQQNVAGTWSPAGSIGLTVLKTSLH